jgi:hypothetical protein
VERSRAIACAKDNILLAVGIKVIREPKDPEAEEPDENQLRFVFEKTIKPLVPDLVTGSVQTGSAQAQKQRSSGLYKAENDVVQTSQKGPENSGTPAVSASSGAGTKRAFSEVQRSSLANPSSSSAVPLVPEQGTAAEEEGRSLYRLFKARYPADHFDEPKTKPSFGGKTKTQQRHVLDRLRLYLDCERWKDAGGKWIPFSSNWLETYEADPAPDRNRTRRARRGCGRT